MLNLINCVSNNPVLMTGMGKYIMKKLLLTLTLALISTDTMAEWTKVGESDNKGGYTAYADLASIRKAGNRVKMWALFDYKIEQKISGVNFLSEKIRREYDCKEEQTRILAFSLFSWNMERGELVRSYSQPQKWEEIQPESMDETEWKIACSKHG